MPTLDPPLSVALQSWQNFYMLTGAAAATLTGLMFIAVTFGESLVTKETTSTARAFLDPVFMHFVQVLFTACVLTIPTLTHAALGVVVVGLGSARLVGTRWVFKRYLQVHKERDDIELSDWVAGIVLPTLVYALLVASGVGLFRHESLAFTGLAVGTLGVLVLGIYCAWELLVWMAVVVSDRRAGDPPPRKGPAEP